MAQDVDENDRIPQLPEPSIVTSLPPELADPGGVRSALASGGITLAVNYTGDILGNPTGGFRQGAQYMGRLDLQLAIDMQKAIGWKGLTFFTNGYQIHGDSLSAANLGALMPASFIESLPSTRLFEMWFEQQLAGERLSLRIGQLSADSEFVISESGAAFLNASWGWPSLLGINLPDGGPSYPMAAPGARLAFKPNDTLGFLFGLFSGDPAGDCPDDELPQQCNPHGLLFPFTSPLLMVEAALRYNQGEGELAGTLKFGTWRYFGSFVPQAIGNNGLPIGLKRPGFTAIDDYGYYALLDQMIYRRPGGGEPKGVTVFGSYIVAPPDGNMIGNYWEAGVAIDGIIRSRPNDKLGIGILYTGVSSQVVDYYRAIGAPVVPSFEAVLEVSYAAEIVPGFILQPDFQYYWNPGGHAGEPDNPYQATPDAAVMGLRTSISY